MRASLDDRSVAPIVGNILLVAVAVVIAVTVTTLSFAFLEGTGAPTADASFEYEQTEAGLRVVPEALGTDVAVKLNGEQVATLRADAAGEGALVPTAPGDTITIVSQDGDRSVLVNREIDDRSEVGDFIAYYRFDSGTGDVLVDRANNGNDGTLKTDDNDDDDLPQWRTGGGGCLRFDGADDHVIVEDISSPRDLDEFTVAVTYRQRDADFPNGNDFRSIDQLVEHEWSGNEWYLETKPTSTGSTEYGLHYAVKYPDQIIKSENDGPATYGLGERHVAVATYDGTDYALYVDGEQVTSKSFDRPVDMGDMRIGRDYEDTVQYLDGDVCEMRLYYQAFGTEDVAALSAAMS
jgi:FlaG/FlaF family flagellin (archaellin)